MTALRDLPGEPSTSSQDPTDRGQWIEWSSKKESLGNLIKAQVLLIPVPELRERLTFVADAMDDPEDLRNFGRFSEMGSRYVLCAEALDCLGAYYRGEPMPPERSTTTRARTAIKEGYELRHPE